MSLDEKLFELGDSLEMAGHSVLALVVDCCGLLGCRAL